MRLYWRTRKRGLDLCVEDDTGDVFIVGGVRETKRGGIEAIAKTRSYDPGRSARHLNSIEDGRAFVEQFQPWREFFYDVELVVEDEVVAMDRDS